MPQVSYALLEADSAVRLLVDGQEIGTTHEHPFWVENLGWVQAGNLTVGDVLWSLDGSVSYVENIEVEEGPLTVYNLEVEGLHNYFVSEAKVLVHNKLGPRVARAVSRYGLGAGRWLKGVARGGEAAASAPKGLKANPFKGKTPQQIDKMLRAKGYEPRGPNPLAGKGGYVNPKTGRSYHIDPGATYKKGTELPHVDVNRLPGSKLPKRKYPLGDSLWE